MSIKLKDVHGVMIEKLPITDICCCDCIPCKTDTCDRCELSIEYGGMNGLCKQGDDSDYVIPFNSAIDQLSEREIGMNRDKLIIWLKKYSPIIIYAEGIEEFADAIISHEHEILQGVENA